MLRKQSNIQHQTTAGHQKTLNWSQASVALRLWKSSSNAYKLHQKNIPLWIQVCTGAPPFYRYKSWGTGHPLKTTSIELRCKRGWNILSWLGAWRVALCILREPVLPWIFSVLIETWNWIESAELIWWHLLMDGRLELGCHSFVTLRGSKQCRGSILEWPWSARIVLGRSLHMYRIKLRKTIQIIKECFMFSCFLSTIWRCFQKQRFQKQRRWFLYKMVFAYRPWHPHTFSIELCGQVFSIECLLTQGTCTTTL